jgi:DNA repair protein RadD
MSFELRPYQAEAIQKLRIALAGGSRRIILCSPTGSGKTEIGMEVIRGAQAKGKRVAFLANRVHLVEQTSRRLAKAGIQHGVIQAENSRAEYLPVIVASIQTVAKRGLPEVDVILIDEAHAVAGSKEFRAVVMAAGVPVVGLSATPWSKGLGKHYAELGGPLFEELITAITIPELIELGFLVDAEVYAPSEPDLSRVKVVAGDYNEAQLGEAVDKPELIGDIVTHWLKLANGMPTVCFATNIAHSKHIVSSFEAVGVKAAHIDCYTNDRERQDILAKVASGEVTIISNVGILTEGWDFPACRVLILARPTKSMIRYIQMAGRVLRPHDGKEHALILDHSGSCKRLGFPTDHIESTLDDGKPKTSSARKEEAAPLPKACPVCHFLKAPKVSKCPACGFKPDRQSEVEVAEGELTLMKKTKKSIAKNVAERYGDKQTVYSMLLYIARDRGYKDGWVANKYRNLFEVWPKGLNSASKIPTADFERWIKADFIRFAKAKAKVGNAAA